MAYREVGIALSPPEFTALTKSTMKLMCFCGLFMWWTSPCLALVAVVVSSCERGAPWPFYVITLVRVAATRVCERICMGHLRRIFATLDSLNDSDMPSHEKGAVGHMADRFNMEWAKSDSFKDGLLDSWEALFCFGVLQLLDLDTDNLQFGQVRICEAEDPSFNAQYAHSYHVAFIQQAVQQVGLSSLFLVLLLVVYINQGVRGSIRAVRLLRSNVTLPDHPDDRQREKAETNLIEAFVDIAQASLWAHMNSIESIIRRAVSVDELLDAERRKPYSATPHNGELHERDTRIAILEKVAFGRQVVFNTIRDIVLLENAPSLYLTAGFFCARLHSKHPLTGWGVFKVVFSFIMSSVSAAHKGIQAIQFGRTGKAMFVMIFLFVLVPAVKMVAAFFCPTSYFSLMTMRCDASVKPS